MENEPHFFSPDEIAKAERLGYLIFHYMEGTIKWEEWVELEDWILEDDHHKELFHKITEEINLDLILTKMDGINPVYAYGNFKAALSKRKPSSIRRKMGPMLSVLISSFFLLYVGLTFPRPYPDDRQKWIQTNPVLHPVVKFIPRIPADNFTNLPIFLQQKKLASQKGRSSDTVSIFHTH